MREEGLVTMPHYLIETWRVAPIPSITHQLMALTEGHTSCPAPLPRTGTYEFAGLVCHEQIANNAPAKCSCSMAKQTGAGAAAAGTQPSPVQSSSVQAPQSGNKCQMQTARRDQNICPTSVAIPLVPVPVPLPISNARPAPAKL